jgi:hypothetical protein
MEDELVITVIATGFDTEYFTDDEPATEKGDVTEGPSQEIVNEVKDIDMSLDQSDSATIFAEENGDNIWNQPSEEEDESDTPAFLRRRKKRNKKGKE